MDNPKPKTVSCQWLQVDKTGIVECSDLPTTFAPKPGKYYCAFHYRIGKDFEPIEEENKKPK